MKQQLIKTINWNKVDGLIPCIVQDNTTQKVLMMGYMNQESLSQTLRIGNLVFYSRTKSRLWMKGEESGNILAVKELLLDCDQDTLLAKVEPMGPVCHLGDDTCWQEKNNSVHFLEELQDIIHERKRNKPKNSYTTSLFNEGINKIAQKVGEEAVELIIESKDNEPALFLNESADLIYHFLVLLTAKGHDLSEVIQVLKERQ